MKHATFLALLSVAFAGELSPVDIIRQKFYNLEKQLWHNVSDPLWRERNGNGDVELTKAFAAFNADLATVVLPTELPLRNWLWMKVTDKLRVVDNAYGNFVGFVKKQAAPGSVAAPVSDWLDMTTLVLLDPEVSVKGATEKLHEFLQQGNIFRSVLHQQEDPDLCHFQLSQHQLIYDMYNTISLTEIKGYAMMQFSWMLLKIYGKGNYTQEASLTRQRYGERTAKTALTAKAALAQARRDVYQCDPSVHKEGLTYAQVTRLLQGYIENEVDMNKDAKCSENCAHYTLAENHGCYKDSCFQQETCKGRIFDCRYIDSDMWVCPAGRRSNRRYEWIEYENDRKLGKVGYCTRGTTKVDSWWRWLFWHCSFCMCLCDDASQNSDRYFSLWEATSDVKNNKVVTGLRIVKIGRVFHLQVFEGTLGERGSIKASGWVPVVKFDPQDSGITNGVDYHMLTYEKRAIDLDELDSPAGSILTGVRFHLLGAHLHFEIRSTPFNYTTGRLRPEKSIWIGNENTDGSDKPRSRLLLHQPDMPTASSMTHSVDSTHDQYLEFTNTDFDADAAQSTVPFIDIQPVQPMNGAALASGAGIIHRGAHGSGGFLAAKLITYDYRRHVSADPPPLADPIDDNDDFAPSVN